MLGHWDYTEFEDITPIMESQIENEVDTKITWTARIGDSNSFLLGGACTKLGNTVLGGYQWV